MTKNGKPGGNAARLNGGKMKQETTRQINITAPEMQKICRALMHEWQRDSKKATAILETSGETDEYSILAKRAKQEFELAERFKALRFSTVRLLSDLESVQD